MWRRHCLVDALYCPRSSGVEHSLGKGEAIGSIPIVGTIEDDCNKVFGRRCECVCGIDYLAECVCH